MKQVKIIWLLVAVVAILFYVFAAVVVAGATAYLSTPGDLRVKDSSQGLSVAQVCNSVDDGSLVVNTGDLCKRESSIRVGDNYGEQKTIDASELTGGDELGCLVLNNEGGCNEY